MSLVVTLITATWGLMILFTIAYLLARRMDNYGIVDIVWAYCFTAVAWYYAWVGPGFHSRKVLLALLGSAWSLRLGTHLYRRVMGHHPEEDSRYRQLRTDWAGVFAPKMFGFFQLQAISVIILSTPFLIPTRNVFPGLNLWELAGTAIVVISLFGEGLADTQLAAFRRDSASKGKVCDVGLWRYSRHPNYFFEWCIWVGFCCFACGSSWGWISVIAPLSILYLLLNVTGVPMAEASSLQSKGDAFRAYQRRTNAFFPGPPKSN
jgi:steroid 5-alpha reductase family enzyme